MSVIFILCEDKRHHMAQMHAIATWPAASVEEERLPLLIPVQNLVEITMRKEHPPAKEDVRAVARQSLETLQERRIDAAGTKLVYELVVVDRQLLAVLGDGALDVPGSYDLAVRIRRSGLHCWRLFMALLLLRMRGDGRRLCSRLRGHSGQLRKMSPTLTRAGVESSEDG